ncbi:NF-kappa-B inhibitor zeta-like isoform X2 [Xyrauchen texanus]|uniref:NF-kappa-B inhibitor zeta-like isoform X2 n=1 Tax=Xyrauchen texanus TaxID=154827 RepID=UPI0022429337|nr:NF-kappa-B inhibitor zeta-like isoform X2 [Xyrauchen texanus]
MVSSQVWATGREMLPVSRKTKHTECSNYSFDGSPLPGRPASNVSGPNLLISTQNPSDVKAEVRDVKNICVTESPIQTGQKKQKSISERKYLGVRVKMPVRDMLKNIRIAKGIDPKDLEGKSKASIGDKKRVNTGTNLKKCPKRQTKSLEDLAIIVKVLEEDLKTCQSFRSPNKSLSASYCSEYREKCWGEDATQHSCMAIYGQEKEFPLSPGYLVPSENSPVHSVCSFYPSPAYHQGTDIFLGNQDKYSSFESDDYKCEDQYGMTYSPSKSSEYQVPSPQESFHFSPNSEAWEVSPNEMNHQPWRSSQQDEWSSMAFFCAQMQREENLLKEISDQELLAVDNNGRILLHRMVEDGKRALVYVIARRMAALKKLDMTDSEGKTPLHLAAQRNQNFMVADLLSLGADVNEKDRYGKTCLHLSAQNGYIRVLEVLKGFMRNGIFINLEERDANGLSALQCAAVALNHTVRELEICKSAGQVRLHTLRKEQMMETLECLLQMESHLHALGHLNANKRGVDSKPCEQAASFQSD